MVHMGVRFCSAIACETRVSVSRVFCPRHWRALPDACKRRLMDTYVQGQFKNGTMTDCWVIAVRDAVATLRDIAVARG